LCKNTNINRKTFHPKLKTFKTVRIHLLLSFLFAIVLFPVAFVVIFAILFLSSYNRK